MKRAVRKDQFVKESCSKKSAPIKRAVWTVLSFIWAELMSWSWYTPSPYTTIHILKLLKQAKIISLLLRLEISSTSVYWETLIASTDPTSIQCNRRVRVWECEGEVVRVRWWAWGYQGKQKAVTLTPSPSKPSPLTLKPPSHPHTHSPSPSR